MISPATAPRNRAHEVADLTLLGHEPATAGLERLGRGLGIGVRGQHHDVEVGVLLTQSLRRRRARAVGQAVVDDDDARPADARHLDRLLDGSRPTDNAEVGNLVQREHERLGHELVVVDDEDRDLLVLSSVAGTLRRAHTRHVAVPTPFAAVSPPVAATQRAAPSAPGVSQA